MVTERHIRRTVEVRWSPHTVYRAFDATGTLLYIGCTVDFERRKKQHSYTSRWFFDAVEWTTEEYPTFRTARDAERHAIETEGALYNCTPAENGRRSAKGAQPIRDAKKEKRRRFAAEIKWAHENRRNCPIRDCHTCMVRELEDRVAAKEAAEADA
jgi:predicted GIY-YIG superfamily endonuclease